MSVTEPLVVARNGTVYGDTYLNSEKFRYTWTIHNFSNSTFRSDGSNLKSSIFLTIHNDEIVISWCLEFNKDSGNTTTPTVYDTYYLVSGRVSKRCKITGKIEFSLINENTEKSIKREETINELYKPMQTFQLYPKYCIVARKDLIATDSGFCPNDKLTITCDITLEADQLRVTSKECVSNQQVPEC